MFQRNAAFSAESVGLTTFISTPDTAMLCLPVLALLVALAIDHFLGEPPVRFHPVVWIGSYLTWAGEHVQSLSRQALASSDGAIEKEQSDLPAFALGALAWLWGILLVGAAAFAIEQGLLAWLEPLSLTGLLVAALLLGIVLKPALAWAMLRAEAQAVEHALSGLPDGSLARGRERLRFLVSRDVSNLSELQVRESVIESFAENLNDSVVAPIFWYMLLGLPGALMYRFANTADAMWGYPGMYQGRNWRWAGKWAAHADDVLSWLPARITAVLLLLSQDGIPLKRLIKEASKTPSPNSGWPMAAMSIALDVRLEKPGVYVLNLSGKSAESDDINHAINLSVRALTLFLVGLIFFQVLMGLKAML
jgi:adenosylcobinamide-phosphate synthase